jgi:hypothetical protein
MGKTKSLGTKVEPEFGKEIERLKEAFGFLSFGELLEGSIKLLQAIDRGICHIQRHPRDWNENDVAEYLSIGQEAAKGPEIIALVERRLRERFGQDGVEQVQQLLGNQYLRQRTHRE